MRFKKKIKQKIKQLHNKFFHTFLYRIIHSLAFRYNQNLILHHAKKHKDFIVTLNPKGSWLRNNSNVEHYYHFIFDLIFPIQLLLFKLEPDVTILLKDIGILSDKIHPLLPENVKIIDDESKYQDSKKIVLLGMSPLHLIISSQKIFKIVSTLKSRFNFSTEGESNKILLIERLPPSDFYLSKAKRKGGGTSRRSIINHDELKNFLKENISDSYSFVNLQLENMSMVEQIMHFQEAHMVIAQHGASLANAVWMKPGSIMLELRSEKKRHFFCTSKKMGLKYFRYKLDSIHTTIDINHFEKWIMNNTHLRELMSNSDSSSQMDA
jgi:Glycosyltransferase 61